MKAHHLITALALCISPIAWADSHGEKKPAAEKAKTPDITLELSGNDTLQFDKKAFEVTEGQVVKLVFNNTGNLPKEAMGHNVVVLKPGTDVVKFALEASKPENRENDFLPSNEEHKKQIVAHTKLLGPGETDSLTFTAGAPGKYEYVCTFPGHFGVMRGIITVKAK